jgi:small subunit ribosomal protein S13
MARIAGVDLPREKRSDIGLTYVFGIGRAAARNILDKAGIDGAIRVKDLSEDQIVKIREIIDQDYQGLRHRKGLPVRGQRSKTNARTRKGRRAGVGSKPKPASRPAPTA